MFRKPRDWQGRWCLDPVELSRTINYMVPKIISKNVFDALLNIITYSYNSLREVGSLAFDS